MTPRLTAAALAAAAFSLQLGCARAQTPTQPMTPETGLQAPAEKVEPPRSREAVAAAERRDAQLLYEVLVGELTVGTGDAGAGYSLLLDAARRGNDEGLYQRATEVAIAAHAGEPALAAVRAWQRAFPESRAANRYLLQILVVLNRIDDSATPLAREIALTPPAERAALYTAIPALYARAGDKAAARQVVQRALGPALDHPATPAEGAAAWTTLGRMRLASGDRAGTLEAAQRAQALDPAAQGPAVLGLDLLAARTEGAEALVRRYLQLPDALPELRLAYARVLSDNHRDADARAELERLVQQRPAFAEGWLLMGAQQAQDGRPAEAEQSLQRYLKMIDEPGADAQATLPVDPETRQRSRAQAYLLLSQIAQQRGDAAQAERWLGRIDNPQLVLPVQLRRASLLAAEGRLPEARALIQALPARSPADLQTKAMAEAQLLRDAGQAEEAYRVLRAASATAPNNADLLYEEAMTLEKLGRLDEMERQLRRVIALEPERAHAYNALGYSLADRGLRLDEARTLITRALQLAPGDPFITDSLGWLEYRAGNAAEAARVLRSAYDSRPDAEIGAHLGEVLWSLGRRDEALAVWRAAQQASPGNAALAETLRRLGARP